MRRHEDYVRDMHEADTCEAGWNAVEESAVYYVPPKHMEICLCATFSDHVHVVGQKIDLWVAQECALCVFGCGAWCWNRRQWRSGSWSSPEAHPRQLLKERLGIAAGTAVEVGKRATVLTSPRG